MLLAQSSHRSSRGGRHSVLAILLPGLAIAGICGCESQSAPTTTAAPSSRPAAAGKQTVAANPGKPPAKSLVTEDGEGRKSIDGIPYDVWFDDPLAIVANSATVPTPEGTEVAPNSTPTPVPDTTPEPKTEPAAPAATSSDWTTYIAQEQLQEETKKIRNHLKGLLQTQANYNESFEAVKMDGAVMAALAGIVEQSAENVNWKPNAPYIRDYGWELVDSAKGLGKPNFDKTQAAYENMQSVFSGSIPPGAAQPAAERPFPETAPRYYLMKRMKLAFNALKLNINTADKLSSNQEEALHEAMVLAALTKVVSLKDYDYADESDYQDFMQQILQNCQTAIAATKDQEFDKFSEALSVIDKACLNCHSQYK